MTVKINKDFNLVVTLDREEGGQIHIHSTPVPQAVFEQYYMIIARAFAEIYGKGLGLVAAPRVAALVLRDIGKQLGMWDAEPGRSAGLLAEIRRLSHVIVPEGRGWGAITLQDALDRKLLDAEDISEVEGVIAFFICVYAMHHRNVRREILEPAVPRWSGQITSLSATEFRDSLPTSTVAESSGAKATSSVPY